MTTDDITAQVQHEDDEDYRRVFRRHVFQLLKWGYDRLNASAYRASEEEDITGELVKALNEIIEDRSCPYWVGNMYIGEDPHVNVDGRKGKRRKKIDIEFVRVQYSPRPRFFFEAKRLSAGTHATTGKYLGPEGLGEFLSGNYGRDVDEAGMLGYIQSHTSQYWAEKIRNSLDNEHNPYQLLPDGGWAEIKIIEELDNCYQTKHNRLIGKSPMTILHCLLAFI